MLDISLFQPNIQSKVEMIVGYCLLRLKKKDSIILPKLDVI